MTSIRPVLASVDGLVDRRGTLTLEIPSWTLKPGQVVGLVGPNGAGKTTFLSLLAGLRSPRDGLVRVLGMDPCLEPETVRSQLSYMSDDMGLFDYRLDMLLETLSGYYPTWDAPLVDALLQRFELDPRRRVGQLSRGEGTLARLVIALAYRPRIVLLDEPALGLDLAARRDLLALIVDVAREPGRSVVVASHDLADVERVADVLLVLNRGKVVRDGPAEALLGDGRSLEEALVVWGADG